MHVDFLIIGAGVMGLALARAGLASHPGARFLLIDKESSLAYHASGRNSGVLHAGFYYSPDSLKARFTRLGNAEWQQFCLERGLPLDPCGKLVVAQAPAELPALALLHQRGLANGVPLEWIDEAAARDLEPLARTCQSALWSPSTAVVEPRALVAALAREVTAAGAGLQLDTAYLAHQGQRVFTNHGAIEAGYILNAAGLQADRVARDFGFSRYHAILPFKGLYLYADAAPGLLRRHVYPVPNLAQPFLGVHLTRTVSGGLKLGPTALPALWREHYQGLERFRWAEMGEIGTRLAGLWWRNDLGLRTLARQEAAKYRKSGMVKQAAGLLQSLPAVHGWRWGAPGLRAQLLDRRGPRLEMDFVWEGDRRSFHLLNAVSPGLTCALPFGRHLWRQVESLAAP